MSNKHQIEHIQLEHNALAPMFIAKLEPHHIPNVVNLPHRHSFHELLWIRAGTGRHWVDQQSYPLQAHTLALVAQGQVHVFEQAEALDGYYLRYDQAFLPTQADEQQPSFRANGGLQLSAVDSQIIDSLFELLAHEYQREDCLAKYHSLRHLLLTLLWQSQRLSHAADQPPQSANYAMYRQFLALLEQAFQQHHDIHYYADQLNLSKTQLAQIISQHSGQPPKRIILKRILLEAQRYLQFTTMPIQQLAQSLGFHDPFHFSKFFKQELGISPRRYREQSFKK
ncbi:MAG: helix-turn-helix transcriptional regulator [Chloroflexi bacterium]|nr:helix-turn-helix transcriptional regulator [Chloroflexota bacterium]